MTKIIYHSYSPSYAAAIAAAIHLSILPVEYIPNRKTLFSIPYFGSRYASCFGTLIYTGIDDRLNEIYILGAKDGISIIKNALSSVNDVINVDESLYYADMSEFDTPLMCGWWLRCLPIGLCYLHFRRLYIKMLQTVNTVKRQAAE